MISNHLNGMAGVLPASRVQPGYASVPDTPNANTPGATASRGAADRVSLGSSVSTRWDTPAEVASNFDVDAVVNNISGPIMQALERARSEGASPETLASMRADAAAGIQTGMAEAQEVIRGLGLMSSDLSDKLTSAESRLMDLFQASTPEPTGPLAGSARIDSAQIQRNDFSFRVTTAEGDVIELTARAQNSRAAHLSGTESDRESTLAARWFDANEQAFSLSVEGELDATEKAALSDLMQNVENISRQFFNGDYAGAFDQAQELQLGSDALASMSLNLTQQSSRVATYQSIDGETASESSVKADNDWLTPMKQYARELVAAQRETHDRFTPQAFMEALQAHPRQQTSLIDFARSVMQRL